MIKIVTAFCFLKMSNEYCIMYFWGLGDKLEIYPLPFKQDLIVSKAYGENVVNALNFLSQQGWKLENVLNIKKTKIMQYLFTRPRSAFLTQNPPVSPTESRQQLRDSKNDSRNDSRNNKSKPI